MTDFVTTIDCMIQDRRKMTSPLYQVILGGKATGRLLGAFALHRYPIKSFWTRNVLAIASNVGDYELRASLVENIYEEETGRLTESRRHVASFADFAACVGVTQEQLDTAPLAPETREVIRHNVRVCNGIETHFTAGVASVLLLMEGQPPIVSASGSSMMAVMRDEYGLPPEGHDFFVHHASQTKVSVSDLEEGHASVARRLLHEYCTTEDLQAAAVHEVGTALELRHRHFDMILATAYDPSEPVFRFSPEQ
jgi:pyrroloquinoline-quinone synthase